MSDPPVSNALLNRKLDEILAGQARAAERDGAMDARLEQIDGAVRSVLAGIERLGVPLAALSEAIEKLSEAAAPKKAKSDIGDALRGVQHKLGELVVQTGRVADGVERLPAIMEDTALNAAKLATGDGAGPRPKA